MQGKHDVLIQLALILGFHDFRQSMDVVPVVPVAPLDYFLVDSSCRRHRQSITAASSDSAALPIDHQHDHRLQQPYP